jgi:hypothetical protein
MVWGYPHDLGNVLISTNTIITSISPPQQCLISPRRSNGSFPACCACTSGAEVGTAWGGRSGTWQWGFDKMGIFHGMTNHDGDTFYGDISMGYICIYIYIYSVYITNQLDMIWAVTELGYTHQIAIFKGRMMANHCNSRYLILWGLPVTISSANIDPAMRGGLEISLSIKTGCSQALS